MFAVCVITWQLTNCMILLCISAIRTSAWDKLLLNIMLISCKAALHRESAIQINLNWIVQNVMFNAMCYLLFIWKPFTLRKSYKKSQIITSKHYLSVCYLNNSDSSSRFCMNSVWFTGSCVVCIRWCWWCWCCVRSSGRVGEQRLIYWFLCCMYTMMLMVMLCQILRTCRWTAFDLLVLVLYVYDDADVVSDPQDVSVNSVWFTGSCVVCIRWCWWCWCCVRSSGRVGEQRLIYWFLWCM